MDATSQITPTPHKLYTATLTNTPGCVAIAVGECRRALHATRVEFEATDVTLEVAERGHTETVKAVAVDINTEGELSLVVDSGEGLVDLPMEVILHWMLCQMQVIRTLPVASA